MPENVIIVISYHGQEYTYYTYRYIIISLFVHFTLFRDYKVFIYADIIMRKVLLKINRQV